MSNRAIRSLPSYHAIFAEATVRREPRSKRIHCPFPCADQRVAREPSKVFAGTFPSLALAAAEMIESRMGSAPITLTHHITVNAESALTSLFPPIFGDHKPNLYRVRTRGCCFVMPH